MQSINRSTIRTGILRNSLINFGRTVTLRCNSTLAAPDNNIPLQHVPSLPLLGSTIPFHSGMDFLDLHNLFSNARKKYGDFYTIGIPNLGTGLYGTLHIVQDPQEMMKVLRAEGKYPTSSVQNIWSFKAVQNDYEFGRAGEILGYGEDWKLIRGFLQNDLLSPDAARRYLPGILQTVPFISKGMPGNANNLDQYLNRASFDMFNSILIGAFPRITDPDTDSDPVDVEFSDKIAHVIGAGLEMTRSVKLTLLHKLGIKSSEYKNLYKEWSEAIEYPFNKFDELERKRAEGTLTPSEKASYWNQAMNRLEEGKSGLTKEEVNKICLTLFNVSVDTTSTKTAWHLLHLGLNEEAQEKLYEEILHNVQETDGKITPALFAPSNSPYLGAVLRESNRLTCPANLTPIRTIASEVEIHGNVIPTGSVIAFDQGSKSLDPEFVDDPHSFRPERFLPDAIAARKGTKAEFLDHPLFSGPFGQGARRCPGSRVARNESLALIAQCVLDWKMSVPGYTDYRDVPYALETLLTPKLPTFAFEGRNRASFSQNA